MGFRGIMFFVWVLLGSHQLEAQYKKLQNQPKYDRKPLHFGFTLGINYMDFHIRTKDLVDYPEVFRVFSTVNSGFNIGIVSDLAFNENLNFRFIPAFATTNRVLNFEIEDSLTGRRAFVVREIESAFIELPVELKFKSDRINNYRFYLIGGVKYALDLASNENVRDPEIFKIKSRDFGYELGFGLDIYFEFFKMSPQVKATFGQANLNVDDGTLYSEIIERLETRSLLFQITFE